MDQQAVGKLQRDGLLCIGIGSKQRKKKSQNKKRLVLYLEMDMYVGMYVMQNVKLSGINSCCSWVGGG